jgi:hypothetical protein
MDAIQGAATNILVTSRYYSDHTIQPGRLPARARAANTTLPHDSPPPTGDVMMESVIDRIRAGEFLSGSQARWIRDTYSCIHCFRKTHGTESCHKLANLYEVKKHPGGERPSSSTRPPSTRPTGPRPPAPAPGGAARKATEGAEDKDDSRPAASPSGSTVTSKGEHGRVVVHPTPPVTTVTDDDFDSIVADSESVADESDDTFALFDTLASSDHDLVHSIANIQARRTDSETRLPTAPVPIPISLRKAKTVAKIAKTDLARLAKGDGGRRVHWDSDVAQALNVLANQSPIYTPRANRTLCPDSRATSNMCPYRDMFMDYRDIRKERQYVRLGDENKRILIHGRGTMCVEVAGQTIANADTLHVPQLSAILLSTRVHHRAAPGCSFLADSSGCFLTYPNFQIEVDDTADCTISCTAMDPSIHTFDFDSRRYTTQHSSKDAVRVCQNLVFRAMQHSRLSALHKSKSHLSSEDPCDSSFPTVPVHSVPNSGASVIEHINAFELRKHFGSRGMSDWTTLEHTGTGLHVVQDKDAPTTLGDITTISRNNSGKLLQRPPQALHTIGMDIGYGEGTSPGGYKYALTLVDYATRYTWTYGLKNKTVESVIDALWCFFVDAGGMPRRIRCDFDSSFVKGKVCEFLKQHQIKITSAPPNRQSQNGLVERQWRTAVAMARAMLIEARLP